MDPATQEILFILGALVLGAIIGALYGYSSGLKRAWKEQRHRRALRNNDDSASPGAPA